MQLTFLYNLCQTFLFWLYKRPLIDKLGCHKACKVPSLGELFSERCFRFHVIGRRNMKTPNRGRIKEWWKKSWQNKIRAFMLTMMNYQARAGANFRSFQMRDEVEAHRCVWSGVNMLCQLKTVIVGCTHCQDCCFLSLIPQFSSVREALSTITAR